MTATAARLSQVYPLGSRINERGRLELGGCDAVELAREFGTPAYVVVEDDLRARARSFLQALGSRQRDFDVLFASKAFPCTAVYRVLAEEGLACDVASIGELAGLGDFPVYNVGGGLGVSYTSSQRAPSVEDYVHAVVEVVHDLLGKDKRLLLEPGRALVANSTVTLYTIETVKRNVSSWVAVDGGMSDNLRPMLYGAAYEAIVADRVLEAPSERCHVAGKHCESGDVIVRDAALPDPGPGDVIATPATV